MKRSIVLLCEVLKLKRGYDLPQYARGDGNIPVVSSSGITGRHLEAKVTGPGVITGRYGTLGEVFFVKEPFWPLNTALYVQDFKGNHPHYIFYFLKWVLGKTQSSKAAVPGVNRNDLHARNVCFASNMQEQLAIASILSAYDDLIENNRRRIHLLEESARQLYKEWFVRLHFPGHEHVKVVDGVPKGWEKMPLGDVLLLQRGFDLPAHQRSDGNFPVCASTGICGKHNEYKAIGPGVVTGRSGSLGTVLMVAENFWPLNTTLWIKEYKKTTPFHARYLLESLALSRFNGGAAVPTLNRNDVHSQKILLPPENLIKNFTDIARAVFNQQTLLEKQNNKLAQARDLLLPKLMSGKVAV